MSKNNEPAAAPRARAPYRMDHRGRDAIWRGSQLWFRGKLIARIIQDKRYPSMWRVALPNGTVSDMVNISRAKDAAMWLTGRSK